jgi:hypothetical protein
LSVRADGGERRRDAERDTRAEREEEGDEHRPAIEREVGVRRQRRDRQSAQHREADRREQEPRRAARNGEQCALGEELSNEPAAPGADRHPHRELLAARDGARQQRAGEVGAGDEKDQSRAPHQDEERSTRVPHHRVP